MRYAWTILLLAEENHPVEVIRTVTRSSAEQRLDLSRELNKALRVPGLNL